MKTTKLAAIALSLLAAELQAAIPIASPVTTYSQSFDTLSSAASSIGPWANNSTLAGWSLFISTGASPTTLASNNGNTSTGSFISLGANGSSDRALGGLGSSGTYFGSPAAGNVAGYIALALENTSGVVFDSFTLSFRGEQWRNGGNASAQTMVFEYGFGTTFASVATWTQPGGLFNFTSPTVGALGATLDGNAVANSVNGLGGTQAVVWVPGQTLWLRWIERNDLGNDHALAIDDLAFSVSAVPEPSAYALLMAGLAAVGFVVRRRR